MHEYITALLDYREEEPAWQGYIRELFAFGYKNALSCLFPVYIFSMLGLSHFIHIPGLYRYDLLLILCLGMQALMVITKMETLDELLVITLFHLLGLGMEIFKVKQGCWAYNEVAYTKVMNVPLYSGFMYASVASYICQAWRRLDLKMHRWPRPFVAYALAIIIYGNFFANAYVPDLRYIIFALVALVFLRTRVDFNSNGPVRYMPMLLAFFLIGLFIWFAENIATLLGAWKYTYQHAGWQMVHVQKLGSWFLMVIVSVIIVAQLKFEKERIQDKQGHIVPES